MNGALLHGKSVMVIGGETELGRAIVIGLAEAGADVAIASLTPDTQAEFAINSALNELWALDRKGIALTIDAWDSEMLRRAADQAEREVGELDLVVVAGPKTAHHALDQDVMTVLEAEDAAEALMAISERLDVS